MKNSTANNGRSGSFNEQIESILESISLLKAGKSLEVNLGSKSKELSELYIQLQSLDEFYSKKLKKLESTKSKLQKQNSDIQDKLCSLEGIAHIGSWTLDVEKDELSYSKEVANIFDHEVPDKKRVVLMGIYFSFVHPDDHRAVRSMFSKLAVEKEPVKIYHRIVLKNKEVKFLEVRGEYHYNPKTKKALITGTIQDVSEFRETKEELTIAKQNLEVKINQRTRDLRRAYLELEKESHKKEMAQAKERELAAIVESSSDAIVGRKTDGTITSWNKGAEELFQFTEKEILGKNVRKLIPKNLSEEHTLIMRNVNLGREQRIAHTKRLKKDGSLIDVSVTISPIKNGFGDVVGISSISRDITEEVRARKRFELAVEASPNAMIMVNAEGKIIMVNSRTETLFGYQRFEILGKTIEMLIPVDLRKTHIKKRGQYQKEPDARFISDGRNLFGLKKDGSRVNVEVGLNPFETNEGKFVLASVVDITQRRKFENQLKESEKRYRTLIETMNEGVLIVDNNDIIQFANDHMCEMTGYTLEEMWGKKATKLFFDEEGTKQMKTVINKRKKGKNTKYEVQMITKSGKKIWSLTSGSPIYDNDDEMVGSVGLHTNITNRKLIEQELNAIANIPRENPNPTFRFSVHGQVLMYANPASQETLEFFDNEEFVDVRKEWVSHINNAFQTGKPDKRELQVNDKIFLCSIVPVVKNGYVNVYAVDVTAAKKAEEEIKRYSLILSKTENAVLVANRSGEIEWVNDAFATITGYKKEELVGTHGEQLRKGRKTGLSENHPHFLKMMKTKKSVSYEAQNFKKNGDDYWTITTLTPIVNDLGEITGVIAIDSDITAKKKAEKEILKAKKIAEDLAQSKELFLANVSHEIRTPMNAISGFTDQIAKGPLTTEQREQLTMVQKSTSHLLHLINDVLDFAKLQRGKVVLEERNFNVVDSLQDIVSFARPMAEAKNNDMVCEIHDDVPTVLCGDTHRLQQIILNILSNAVKFTNDGVIKVSVSATQTKSKDVKLEIVITDTGIGMTPDQLKKIFIEFEQAEVSTARNYGGTGLGLAITKRLIKLFEGSIDVRSEVNKGTTMILILPFKIGKQSEIENNAEPEEIKSDFLKGKKILIVDDEPFNRKLLQSMLKDKDVETTEATNGKEAVQMVKKNEYDLVLMDIRMPELNGIEATMKIRKMRDSVKKDVIIVALTAAVTEKDKRNYLHSGMNGFVPKPFKEVELMSALSKVFKDNTSGANKPNLDGKKQSDMEEIINLKTGVDFKELRTLCGNDEEFYAEMLQTFLDGVYQGIENIRTYYENEDWSKLPDFAHKLSSPARHLGAEKLYKILKTIELDGRNGEFDRYQELVGLFNEEVVQIVDLVKKEQADQGISQ